MASSYGRKGKRKRVEDCEWGVGSSGSGDGHPPTEEGGMRVRGPVVEIKRYCKGSDGRSFDFCKEVSAALKEYCKEQKKKLDEEEKNSEHIDADKQEFEDLQRSKMVGKVIHHFARLVLNPEHKSLQIDEVENSLRKYHGSKDLTKNHIGQGLLFEDMRVRPLKPLSGDLNKEGFKAVKKEIIDRAISFYLDLKSKIIDELSRAGRQRKDEDHFLPAIEGVVPPEGSENLEIQHLEKEMASLKVTHAAELKSKEEYIASLQATHAEELKSKDHIIEGLMATIMQLSGNSELGSQDGETQRPENADLTQNLVVDLSKTPEFKQKLEEAQTEYLIYYQNRTLSPTSGLLEKPSVRKTQT